MTHLKIIQGNNQSDTEEVSMDIINKLYELAVSGDLDQTSELKGYLHLLVGDRAKIEYLTNMFQNKLFITANNYIIPFEDQNMVTYLNSIGVGSNGVITEADAAAATIVANSANTTVTKFNELKYFTQITQSRGGLSHWDDGYVRFAGWTALEEVDISNFTSIGHNNGSGWGDTFSGCTSLKKVVASDKLTVIGVRAFDDCQNLEEITGLDGTLTVYGSAFFRNKKLKNSNFANVEILFPTSDGGESFAQTELITSLTLSAQNTIIPSWAFYGSKIATLNFPAGLTSIQDAAFKNSDLAVNASVLSNVTSFGDSCFTNTKITGTFTANANLVLLNNYAFQESRIQAADLSNIGSPSLGMAVFANCTQLTSVTLPSSMTTLKSAWLLNCSALTSINLGNITTFESECLRGCTSLMSVNFDSCTSIGEHAFRDCKSLTSVDLSNSTITSLSSECFRGCDNLGLVKLPASCTQLGNTVFYGCSNLQISASDLARLTYFGNNCFGRSGLTGELAFPNITSLQANAFDGTTVTKLDFTGSTFTSVGGYFGNGLRSLAKVILPDTVQEIAGVILAGCVGLQYIKCLATTPPTAAGVIGAYIDNPTFKIYVPDASVNAYKAATYWSNHSARIFGLSLFATDFPNG